jgi:single-strand DNA-binding protein
MASLNRVELIGRLGDDPDLRYTGEGTAVANLSLATDESYTRNDGTEVDQTEWHDVTVFGRQAETTAEYTAKGEQVYVEGSLETSQYEDRDGVTRYSTDIIAQRVLFLEGPSGDGQRRSDGPSRQRDPAPGPQPQDGGGRGPGGAGGSGGAPDGGPGEDGDDTFEPDDELPF